MALITLFSGLSRSRPTNVLHLQKSFVRKYLLNPSSIRPSFQHNLHQLHSFSGILHNQRILPAINDLVKRVKYFSITSTRTKDEKRKEKLKVKVVDGKILTTKVTDEDIEKAGEKVKDKVGGGTMNLIPDEGDHTRVWRLERYVSALMAIVVPAAFIHPCAAYDGMLAVLIVLHSHWGFEAICTDYVTPENCGNAVSKLAHILVLIISIVTLAGLFTCIQNDLGIAQGILCVWQLGKEEDPEDKEVCLCEELEKEAAEPKGWF